MTYDPKYGKLDLFHKKIYKCKVWTPSIIHFEAESIDKALELTTRFFSDNDVQVEYIREMERGEVDPTLVFDDSVVPDIIIN